MSIEFPGYGEDRIMTRVYSTPEEHLKRYPAARTSTLAWIAKRNAKLDELRNKPGIKRESRPNVFRRLLRWPAWVWRW